MVVTSATLLVITLIVRCRRNGRAFIGTRAWFSVYTLVVVVVVRENGEDDISERRRGRDVWSRCRYQYAVLLKSRQLLPPRSQPINHRQHHVDVTVTRGVQSCRLTVTLMATSCVQCVVIARRLVA